MAYPGGNATGFTAYESGIATKWLELLKELLVEIGEPISPQPLRTWLAGWKTSGKTAKVVEDLLALTEEKTATQRRAAAIRALGPVGKWLTDEKVGPGSITRDVVFLLMAVHLWFVPSVFSLDSLRARAAEDYAEEGVEETEA